MLEKIKIKTRKTNETHLPTPASITHLKDVACQAFHCVIDRKDVDALAVLDVRAWLNGHDVTQADAKVVPDLLDEAWLREGCEG